MRIRTGRKKREIHVAPPKMESNRKMGARSVERQINAQVIRAGSVKLFIFLAQRLKRGSPIRERGFGKRVRF